MTLNNGTDRVSLAWDAYKKNGDLVFSKNGGVARFISQITIDPSSQTGVFILGNTRYKGFQTTSQLLDYTASLVA